MHELKSFQEVNELLARHVPSLNDFTAGAYTLERMQALMAALGNPQDSYKTIHVAGTSGKTSTSYYVAALLKAAGQKIGLTVSPHIDAVNERAQINLKPLAEDEFCQELGIFLEQIEKTRIKPTYFELLVAFAFWEFARKKVDYAVIEVGLGGLLDGTNVITQTDKTCVITDIGLDHTAVLGRTLSKIAAQKAGIIQAGNQVIMHSQPEEIMKVIKEKTATQNGELRVIKESAPESYEEAMPVYQQRNFELAYATYEYLRERDNLPRLTSLELTKVAKTYIPARMEIIEAGEKTIVMDGAHNAQKMQALANSLKAKYPGQKIATLLALVQTKDFAARTDLRPITDISSHIILTSFKGEQDLPKVSVDPRKLADFCRQIGFTDLAVVADSKAAFNLLLNRPEPILLITGSFYLMNHIRPIIRKIK